MPSSLIGEKIIIRPETLNQLGLEVGSFITQGRKNLQEDSMGGAVVNKTVCVIVTDGVSTENGPGHHGKNASQGAVDVFLDEVKTGALISTLNNVNTEDLFVKMDEQVTLKSGGGATTATCVLIEGRNVDVLNLGDSPCVDIDLKSGACQLLTTSIKKNGAHSLGAHQFLGDGMLAKIHHTNTNLLPGHAIILMSDGGNNAFNANLDYAATGETFFEPEIAQIVSSNSSDEAAHRIVGLALTNGSKDNISVVVIKSK